ncbi:hypothetical protein [Kutzneria sp. NPDC052558]|uniref:hypothetical protein n=1 Tax=Kutzneria sp. NPDC052558 TaxID=3364121 RepID=UPI0037C74488
MLGEHASIGELLDRSRSLAEVDQYERLLCRGMCEQGGCTRLSRSSLRAFVVRPRLSDRVPVECFPTGQGGRLREHAGERLTQSLGCAVHEQVLDLLDAAAKLVKQRDGPEPTVNMPGVVDLSAEQLDHVAVDGPGHGQP